VSPDRITEEITKLNSNDDCPTCQEIIPFDKNFMPYRDNALENWVGNDEGFGQGFAMFMA
jgi:hypothetical protein